MEKRILLEQRGRSPKEISELNLDNCRSQSIVGLTEEFCNLELLSLNNIGLTSLKGFPALPNLKKLELSDNKVSNNLDLLTKSPKLTHLNLSGNSIKDMESLEPLKEFKNLKNLDLYNNDATNEDNYREKVFKLIPGLKYLDGFDANDVEGEDSEVDEEVNGNEDSDAEEEASSEEDDDLEDSVSLGAVYAENLDDLSDEEDYEAGEEEEDDDAADEEDDEEETAAEAPATASAGKNDKAGADAQGKKRKHDESETD